MSNYHKNITIVIFCFLLLCACENKGRNNNKQKTSEKTSFDSEEIYFLDFEKNLKNVPVDTFTINSIARNITFIPLETSADALLTIIDFKVEKINESYYISSMAGSSFSGILEFDSAGRYIDYLVRRGQGPKELPGRFVWSYNNYTQQLVASSSWEIVLHSFEKDVTSKHTLSQYTGMIYQLNDGNIVGLPGVFGTGETDVPYLSFIDQKGKMMRQLYYSKKRDIFYALRENQGNIGPLESYWLYKGYLGEVLFKDMFNDTIYRISNIDAVEPYIVLERGSLTPKVKDATNRTAKAKTVIISRILDTEKYIFIVYEYRDMIYNAIWDKQTLSLVANTAADLKNNDNIRVVNNTGFTKYRTPNGNEMLVGISNFFDGKLYCVLDAYQAMDFIPGIGEEDNPVLMVIDLK